jgi:predicted nucleic acid-binding protein
MSYLLDNNVLSEVWKPRPDPNVLAWFFSAEWFLPVPVIAEIQEGAEASPSEARRLQINARLDAFLRQHGATVVEWDAEAARTWGRLRHTPEVKRRPQPLWDSLLDAMAVSLGAKVATRNHGDFRHAVTFDPWTGLEHSPTLRGNA